MFCMLTPPPLLAAGSAVIAYHYDQHAYYTIIVSFSASEYVESLLTHLHYVQTLASTVNVV